MKKKIFVLLAVAAVFVLTAMSAFAANSPDLTKYTVTYETGQNGELIIVNTYETEKKDITIEKQWDDDSNRDGYRPTSICVELKANDVVVDNYTLTGTGNTWSYTFTDKVVYNQGEEITYSANENGTTCTALGTPTTENVCLLSGGSWDNSTCTMPSAGGNAPAPTPQPSDFDNQSDCEEANFTWDGTQCVANTTPEP